MNVGIAFGGPNVVEINCNEKRVIFCDIHIIKPCHAARGPFGKVYNTIVHRYYNTFST